MKIKFICPTSYFIGNMNLKYGDIIEKDSEQLLSRFPYLFELVQDHNTLNKDAEFIKEIDTYSKKDLKNFAKKYNIEIDARDAKAGIIFKIKSFFNKP